MELINTILLTMIAAESTFLVAVNTKKISHKTNQEPIFVDTSVLIDGRIIAVAQSGFIGNILNIPRSVVGELQFLADNSDTEKRTRARHGLDIITELQSMSGIKVNIFPDSSRADEGVDNRLLKLAKKHNGSICTIDYNLNKVARVEGIKVLNVNDLAMSLRMAYLPGERMSLELTTKGQDNHQAIGHLSDGTMVVVEHASSFIGKSVEIEFVRSLQTVAGKMMFAKLVNLNNSNNRDGSKKINKAVSRPETNAQNNKRKTKQAPYKKSSNRNNHNKPGSDQRLVDLLNNQK